MNAQSCKTIRWMIRRDMPDVLEIEKSHPFGTAWTHDDFRNVLKQNNVIGMVCEHNDKIVGFMLYELNHKSLHILNLAVRPRNRRSLVGWALIRKLKGKIARRSVNPGCPGRSKIVAVVRESNLEAQQFFRAVGFRAVRVLRGMYKDTSEDGYRFVFEADKETER